MKLPTNVCGGGGGGADGDAELHDIISDLLQHTAKCTYGRARVCVVIANGHNRQKGTWRYNANFRCTADVCAQGRRKRDVSRGTVVGQLVSRL